MDADLFLNLTKSEIRTAITGTEVSAEISGLQADFGKCVAYLSEAMMDIQSIVADLGGGTTPIQDFIRVFKSLALGSFDSHA